MYKIVIVDTDEVVLSDMRNALEEAGYEVFTCNTSAGAIETAKKVLPDLVMLELIMPVKNGIDICMELREEKEFKKTLVLFYTDRKEDFAEISAFNAGADDYVVKPVKTRVLVKRINAMLMRSKGKTELEVLTGTGQIRIDYERYLVYKEGKEVVLPRKEFELLSLLLGSPNKLITRKEISTEVWGYELVKGNRTLDVHIHHLREKLELKNLKTITGVGYYLAI